MQKRPKAEYTAAFKAQAVKRAKDGKRASVVGKEMGLVEQTRRNGVTASEASRLDGPGTRKVTPEEREWSRLRAESRNGNCRDHAPTERGFNSFKNVRVFGEPFSTREAMKATAFESIEVFDNRMRRHSTPGYTSPLRFLKDPIKTQPHEQPFA
jgi:transposase-like protein